VSFELGYEFLDTDYATVRDTVGGALYFGSYEYVKHFLGPQQGRDASHALTVFIAGLTCGSFSSAVVCILYLYEIRD
jgi:hypothetical protein